MKNSIQFVVCAGLGLSLSGCNGMDLMGNILVLSSPTPSPSPTATPSASPTPSPTPVTGFSVTPNFDPATTGWKKANASVTAQIVETGAPTNTVTQSYRCRLAHVSEIASKTFTSCGGSNGLVTLTKPTTGKMNGSFQLDVKSGAQILSTNFYIHTSVDNANDCTAAHADSYYLTTASTYLDQSKTFASTTALANPFVVIGFPAIPAGMYKFADGTTTEHFDSSIAAADIPVDTLRKRFVKNSAGTLILVKRRYDKKYTIAPHDCHVRVEQVESTHDLLTGGVPSRFGGYLLLTQSKAQCDAVVFNALGKGVCFLGTHAYYTTRMKRNLTMVDRPMGGFHFIQSSTTSAKFKAATQAEYNASIAAPAYSGISAADRDAYFIYLEE